jgi:hypothetical protein
VERRRVSGEEGGERIDERIRTSGRGGRVDALWVRAVESRRVRRVRPMSFGRPHGIITVSYIASRRQDEDLIKKQRYLKIYQNYF